MNIPKKKLFTLILNYKSYKDLQKCLNSILYSSIPKDIENYTVVIDVEFCLEKQIILKNKFPKVKFILKEKNLGAGGGYNVGFKYAVDNYADLILMLTPDIYFPTTTISKLIKVIEKNNKIGMVAPKILLPSKPPKIYFVGGEIDKRRLSGGHIGYGEIDNKQYDRNNLLETEFINCSMALIRADLFKKIGYWNENYFLYYEDLDWNMRVIKKGYKVVVDTNSIAYHNESSSVGKGSIKQEYYMTRNLLLFIKKFGTTREKIIAYLLTLKEVFGKTPLLLNKNESKRIKYKYLAILDFLMNKFGYKEIYE